MAVCFAAKYVPRPLPAKIGMLIKSEKFRREIMEPIILNKSDCEANPHLIWNSFIKVIASDTAGMTDIQKKAALCFQLESDVMNGGFFQYFDNTRSVGFHDYQSVIDALHWIGGDEQAELFVKAHSLWRRLDTLNGLEADACGEALERLNPEYDNCVPTMNALFEKLLTENQSKFVLIGD